MDRIGTSEQPLRVAIVGSGPSGFYAAGQLLKSKAHPDLVAQVDMYDRLPTPWGLVRGGVAPDHPNIKAVSRVYEKTASIPGSASSATSSSARDLSRRARGALPRGGLRRGRADRPALGIPGEDLPGSCAATEFVAWYNGHPDYRDLEFDLSCERAVVIGNGNVAADVARMLALTRDELAMTDIADHALEVLRERIQEIVVLGRRGPAQAAFTNPELLELGELTDADVFVDLRDVELDEHSRAFIESEAAHVTARKNVEILAGYAGREPGGRRAPDRPALPRLAGGDPGRGQGRGGRDRPERACRDETGAVRARATEEHEMIDAGSCSARSAIAACRSRTCRSTSAAA